jgi:hypothetical protein
MFFFGTREKKRVFDLSQNGGTPGRNSRWPLHNAWPKSSSTKFVFSINRNFKKCLHTLQQTFISKEEAYLHQGMWFFVANSNSSTKKVVNFNKNSSWPSLTMLYYCVRIDWWIKSTNRNQLLMLSDFFCLLRVPKTLWWKNIFAQNSLHIPHPPNQWEE